MILPGYFKLDESWLRFSRFSRYAMYCNIWFCQVILSLTRIGLDSPAFPGMRCTATMSASSALTLISFSRNFLSTSLVFSCLSSLILLILNEFFLEYCSYLFAVVWATLPICLHSLWASYFSRTFSSNFNSFICLSFFKFNSC